MQQLASPLAVPRTVFALPPSFSTPPAFRALFGRLQRRHCRPHRCRTRGKPRPSPALSQQQRLYLLRLASPSALPWRVPLLLMSISASARSWRALSARAAARVARATRPSQYRTNTKTRLNVQQQHRHQQYQKQHQHQQQQLGRRLKLHYTQTLLVTAVRVSRLRPLLLNSQSSRQRQRQRQRQRSARKHLHQSHLSSRQRVVLPCTLRPLPHHRLQLPPPPLAPHSDRTPLAPHSDRSALEQLARWSASGCQDDRGQSSTQHALASTTRLRALQARPRATEALRHHERVRLGCAVCLRAAAYSTRHSA